MKKQLVIDDEIVEVEVLEMNASFVLFNLEGVEYKVNLGALQDGKMVLNLNGKNRPVVLYDTQYVIDGREFEITAPRRQRTKSKVQDVGQMKSPMPGKILKILVSLGQVVEIGTPILVMEAMKMEHTIKASKAGTIEKIFFSEGEQVAGGVELVKLC
jgi:3-methylcrotonyl-CoA carboxylase alpha subunit